MKIRTGFVSNSSSSSFCIYGAKLSKELIKKIEETNKEFDCIWEIFEHEKMFYGVECNYSQVCVGLRYDKIGDDETGKEFKERVAKRIEEVVGEKVKCEYIEGEYEC